MRICRAFLMKNAEEALKHINKHTITVQKYGDSAYNHPLYVWDDGERRLFYCVTCKAYILAQWSEYHDFCGNDDSYYDDYVPVNNDTDADYINQMLDGEDLEKEYTGCMLMRTNRKKHWRSFGKFIEYKSANKTDYIEHAQSDLDIPDEMPEPTEIELKMMKAAEERKRDEKKREEAIKGFDKVLSEASAIVDALAKAEAEDHPNKDAFITSKVESYLKSFKDGVFIDSVELYNSLLNDAFSHEPIRTFEIEDEDGVALRKAYPCGDLILFVQYELHNLSIDDFQFGAAYMMLVDGDERSIESINNLFNAKDDFLFKASNYFSVSTVYMKLPRGSTYTLEDITDCFEKHTYAVTYDIT